VHYRAVHGGLQWWGALRMGRVGVRGLRGPMHAQPAERQACTRPFSHCTLSSAHAATVAWIRQLDQQRGLLRPRRPRRGSRSCAHGVAAGRLPKAKVGIGVGAPLEWYPAQHATRLMHVCWLPQGRTHLNMVVRFWK